MWEDKPQIGTKVYATYLIEKVLVYRMDKDIFNKPIRKKTPNPTTSTKMGKRHDLTVCRRQINVRPR